MNVFQEANVSFETVLILALVGLGAAAAASAVPSPPADGAGAADPGVVRFGNDCLEPAYYFVHVCVHNPWNQGSLDKPQDVEVAP